MPINTTFTAAPLPTAAEAGDGPGNMLAYAVATDDLHVLKATSVANRDTLYPNTTAGTLVSCAALGIVWQKTTSPPAAAAWRTLAQVGAPATTGVFTANTAGGWSTSVQWAQVLHGRVTVNLVATYSGSTVTVGATGNITDMTMGTIQPTWAPSTGASEWLAEARAVNRGASVILNSSSLNVVLLGVYPGGNLVSGTAFRVGLTYPAA